MVTSIIIGIVIINIISSYSSGIYHRFKYSNLTLLINKDPKSLYTGRQQNASTTVEVRIWRENALTSKTEAPLALNFVIVAWRINGPLQGDQIPNQRMMVVNLLSKSFIVILDSSVIRAAEKETSKAIAFIYISSGDENVELDI
ncbi:MAG: hypothetical protein EZS28_049499 [Streblomastix strix]|uniref:Uncharacterized protein n=1 Tax=Streblomastix strix TaxID=222440 RepID=A0A5J4T9B5_9EUKA|nr:MAG: hypothetical protein EZS28_049499 [Streblomastix strix]